MGNASYEEISMSCTTLKYMSDYDSINRVDGCLGSCQMGVEICSFGAWSQEVCLFVLRTHYNWLRLPMHHSMCLILLIFLHPYHKQPTLHKPGIMAHRVRVLFRYEKSF
jgi:hypothetical protein